MTDKKTKKNPDAVALGRRGGAKGGKARAEALSPERRSEISKGAANTRWHGRTTGKTVAHLSEIVIHTGDKSEHFPIMPTIAFEETTILFQDDELYTAQLRFVRRDPKEQPPLRTNPTLGERVDHAIARGEDVRVSIRPAPRPRRAKGMSK